MNFRARSREEPEINLIPFIDVLLVILIFLMLTTTYSKFTELQLRLPLADSDLQRDRPKEIIVAVGRAGNYSVNKQPLAERSVEALSAAMREAAKGGKDTVVIISADASAAHQAVITVLESARAAGLNQLTFAAQSTSRPGGR